MARFGSGWWLDGRFSPALTAPGIGGGGGAFTALSATGGTITDTTIGGRAWRYHTFASSADFIVTGLGTDANVTYLAVGSGASGGHHDSVVGVGGGAGGMVRTGTFAPSVTTYPIVIGAAGAAVTGTSAGATGSNVTGLGVTAEGGRGGGAYFTAAGNGVNGGGGGCNAADGASVAGGTGTNFAGGAGYGHSNNNFRAGGGALATGGAAPTGGVAGVAFNTAPNAGTNGRGNGGSGAAGTGAGVASGAGGTGVFIIGYWTAAA